MDDQELLLANKNIVGIVSPGATGGIGRNGATTNDVSSRKWPTYGKPPGSNINIISDTTISPLNIVPTLLASVPTLSANVTLSGELNVTFNISMTKVVKEYGKWSDGSNGGGENQIKPNQIVGLLLYSKFISLLNKFLF